LAKTKTRTADNITSVTERKQSSEDTFVRII